MSLTAGSSASGLARSLHSVRSTWWAFHDKRHKTTQGGISKPPWTHASHCAHSFGHTQGSGTFFFFFSVGRRIPRIFRSFLTGSEIILAHWKRVLLCDESISVSSASQREMIWSYWLVHYIVHYIVLANSIGFHSGNLILPVEVRQFLDVDSTDSAQDVVTKRNQTFAA